MLMEIVHNVLQARKFLTVINVAISLQSFHTSYNNEIGSNLSR